MCGATERKGMQGKNGISLKKKKKKEEVTEMICSFKKEDREQPLPSGGKNASKVVSCGPFP